MSADVISADGGPITAPAPDPTAAGFTWTSVQWLVPSLNTDKFVVLSMGQDAANETAIAVTGYSPEGQRLFQNTQTFAANSTLSQASMVALANGDIATAWTAQPAGSGVDQVDFMATTAVGTLYGHGQVDHAFGYTVQFDPHLLATPTGFSVQWNAQTTSSPTAYDNEGERFDDFGHNGYLFNFGSGHWAQPPINAVAWDQSGTEAFSLRLIDNVATYFTGQNAHQSVTIPNEPVGSITSEAATELSNSQFAVAWASSGSVYEAVFNPSSNSFGAVTQLDWGGAGGVHVVALTDGGYAVSWTNGGGFKGELVGSDGQLGGILSLTGDFAGFNASGDLYTVGPGSGGGEVVQAYATSTSGGGGLTVHTSSPDYTAPDGVTTIYLEGANQTIHANNIGDVIWSDTTSNTLYGGSGNDTFHLGRAGDMVTGGAGNDIFAYVEVPWAGGEITDFGVGDMVDLSGLLSTTQDHGPDGSSDGYLKLADNASGDAQIWARYSNTDSSGWWLVATLDGVSSASLETHKSLVDLSPTTGPSDVKTSDSTYVAPAYVTHITLTGSQQTINAQATNGVTIDSNDTGNTLLGGAGGDVFHLGRGGDVVTGGSGADSFAYAETPWAGGAITDFNSGQGDAIDVTGLLAKSGYAGADPFGDGYLKYTTDSSGDAQLWSDVNQPGNDGWWLVATIDGVSTSSLHYAGGMIT